MSRAKNRVAIYIGVGMGCIALVLLVLRDPGRDSPAPTEKRPRGTNNERCTLKGRVVTPGGRGVAGAQVCLVGNRGEIAKLETDDHGQFLLGNRLAPEQYQLSVEHETWGEIDQAIVLKSGANEVVLQFDRNSRLRLRIRAPLKVHITEQIEVIVRTKHEPPQEAGRTRLRGPLFAGDTIEAEIGGLGVGEFVTEVVAGPFSATTDFVVRKNGEEIVEDVELSAPEIEERRFSRIRGRVFLGDVDHPLENKLISYRVVYASGVPSGGRLRTRDGGVFEQSIIYGAPGTRVILQYPGALSFAGVLTGDAADNAWEVVLEPLNSGVAADQGVRLTSESGVPLSGVEVTINPNDITSRVVAYTDEEGWISSRPFEGEESRAVVRLPAMRRGGEIVPSVLVTRDQIGASVSVKVGPVVQLRIVGAAASSVSQVWGREPGTSTWRKIRVKSESDLISVGGIEEGDLLELFVRSGLEDEARVAFGVFELHDGAILQAELSRPLERVVRLVREGTATPVRDAQLFQPWNHRASPDFGITRIRPEKGAEDGRFRLTVVPGCAARLFSPGGGAIEVRAEDLEAEKSPDLVLTTDFFVVGRLPAELNVPQEGIQLEVRGHNGQVWSELPDARGRFCVVKREPIQEIVIRRGRRVLGHIRAPFPQSIEEPATVVD